MWAGSGWKRADRSIQERVGWPLSVRAQVLFSSPEHGGLMHRFRFGLWPRLASVVLLAAGLSAIPWLQTRTTSSVTGSPGPGAPFANRVDNGNDNDSAWPNPRYMKQADQVANLDAYANDPSGALV